MTAKEERLRTISAVEEGSIAQELGIVPGDILVSIDGIEVRDVFDYRTRIAVSVLDATFLRRDGTFLDASVEKDEEDDLGIEFEEPLMDSCKSCRNKCIFCFIDQLPKGMRKSLYFKDDDLRMSFLTGNYVTLTNLSEEEFDRILSYRLSPMNVSVHATNSDVRVRMMRNPQAADIMSRLERIVASGISLNCQIVLVPGYNDKEILDQTIRDLSGLGERLSSIAVVPVGVTRFRSDNHLVPLQTFNQETSGEVLAIVDRWQGYFLKTRESRMFYAADEFYLRAIRPIPPAAAYEDFPQLENGVGMLADFIHGMRTGIRRRRSRKMTNSTNKTPKPHNIFVLTGVDAFPTLNSFADRLSLLYNVNLAVHPVINRFFGETITVTGLLTGSDIQFAIEDLRTAGGVVPDMLFLSSNMLKADEDVFLDNITLDALETSIGIPIRVCRSTGDGLLEILDEVTGRFQKSRSAAQNEEEEG